MKDGEPCNHPGCLHHITHPCEGCDRIGGITKDNLCRSILMEREFLLVLLNRHEDIVRYLPTARQKQIIDYVKKQGAVTAADVAIHFDITIQNSGVTLARIYKKGFLGRYNAGDPTGGNKFVYTYDLENKDGNN